MASDKDQLIALAERLDDAKTAKDKLVIYDEMARIIREDQKIYRLVEVVKNQLADVSATKALEAPTADDSIDPYAHLTALVNERK